MVSFNLYSNTLHATFALAMVFVELFAVIVELFVALFCLKTSMLFPCRQTCRRQRFHILDCKAALQRGLGLFGVLLLGAVQLQLAWDPNWNEAVYNHSCCAFVHPRIPCWVWSCWAVAAHGPNASQ